MYIGESELLSSAAVGAAFLSASTSRIVKLDQELLLTVAFHPGVILNALTSSSSISKE